jgi:HEAT repeat protein
VQAAIGSHTDAVRAAALPLYARVAPAAARAELERLGGDRQSRALRVGIALGWGALARTSPDDARAALDRLLKDESVEVRAAAAEGYGYLGRAAQETLLRLIKIERLEIGAGAARGMMHTADVGASVPVAVGGIGQLWKRQGKPRREAAAVFAAMARTRPGPIMTYLVAASRNPDDDELHPIGTVGLCHAANQGNPEARRQLMKVTADPSPEVRRLVIRCVADAPDAAKNGLAVATRLMKDPDPQIRADAARVITLSATRGGKVQGGVADALVGLLDDSDREVRLIATHAIGSLGGDAPGAAAPAMVRAFGRADEA